MLTSPHVFLLTDSYQMYPDDDRNHSGKEALDWFVRMQSDSVTEAERAAFIAWRDAKPENAQAYADTELLSHKLAALKGHSAYHIPRLTPDQKPSLMTMQSFNRIALFLLIIFSSAGLWWQTGIVSDEYVTSAGEQRHIPLEDGSKLELNTASHADVRYTRLERIVTLYSGEAYFDIADENYRRFVVLAGGLQVRDIGTRFIVRHDNEQVTVTVLEGEVELTRPALSDRSGELPATLTLLAGQQSHYRNEVITSAIPIDSVAAAAWREGKLIFKATPLREVVQELARYHPLRFVIHDPALADETVTGSFHIGELSSFLRALEQVLQIQIDTRNPDIASIQRRKN